MVASEQRHDQPTKQAPVMQQRALLLVQRRQPDCVVHAWLTRQGSSSNPDMPHCHQHQEALEDVDFILRRNNEGNATAKKKKRRGEGGGKQHRLVGATERARQGKCRRNKLVKDLHGEGKNNNSSGANQ